MRHDRLIFHDIFGEKKQPWNVEVLFNLTYVSDQLLKGVSWGSVNQNCARLVLKLSGMLLNEKKKKKLQIVTVKKQNIVIEYVCCACATTRDPIHVSYAVFSFTHSHWAQGYRCLCVPVEVCKRCRALARTGH